MLGTGLCARSLRASANKLSSPPTHRPSLCAASITPAVSAGLKPGLLKTARISVPSINAASKVECTKVTSGNSTRNTASCGGASRVSTTVTTAPCSAHHRTMARPDAPRPKTMTWRLRRLFMVQRSFKVDRPIRHSRMVMIQKRTTTCVSFQPCFSKWWCSGAIFNRRLPVPNFFLVYLK